MDVTAGKPCCYRRYEGFDCRSALARDCGLTVDTHVECEDLIAGKLTPTVAFDVPVLACTHMSSAIGAGFSPSVISRSVFLFPRHTPIMSAFSPNDFAELVMAERKAFVERDTLETQVKASINLDGTGKARFNIGVPFLEHMLDQIARHGLIDIELDCKGDLEIDDHHTVEDVGITLGQAFSKAIGDKKGIRRYGHAYVPLDEALSRVVIDFSGRPGLQMHVPYTRATVGGFDVDLFQEFFQGFVNHANVTLHIDNLRGHNTHHQIETVFKAFGRALRMAVELDDRMAGQMPSTKGVL